MIIRDLNYEIEYQHPYFEDGALRRLSDVTIRHKKTREVITFDELRSFGDGRIEFKNRKPETSRGQPQHEIVMRHITQACKSIVAAQRMTHGERPEDD